MLRRGARVLRRGLRDGVETEAARVEARAARVRRGPRALRRKFPCVEAEGGARVMAGAACVAARVARVKPRVFEEGATSVEKNCFASIRMDTK